LLFPSLRDLELDSALVPAPIVSRSDSTDRGTTKEGTMLQNASKAMVRLMAMAFVVMVFNGCAQQSVRAEDKELSHGVHDAATTVRIKTAYLFNRHLNAFRINVDTVDGAVTLQGVVKSSIQKDLAGEIARNADGVKVVRNELQVGDGPVDAPEEVDRTFSQAALDATTTASVKLALAIAKGVKASEIGVSTRWGTVVLSGQVTTRDEKKLAESTARGTEGVKDVVNEIQVRG